MKTKRAIHVVTNGKVWKVRIAGNEKAYRVKETKKEAVDCAIELCKKWETDLIIHRVDGSIMSLDPYPNEETDEMTGMWDKSDIQGGQADSENK